MDVRQMDKVGIDSIVEVFNRGFSDYLIPVSMDDAILKDYVYVNDINLRDSFVVFDDGGEPRAFTFTGVRGKKGWVGGLAVDKDHRNEGYGKAVLEAQLKRARKLELDEIWLECLIENGVALSMYRKVGFKPMRKVWFLQDDKPGPHEVRCPEFEHHECNIKEVLPHYDTDHIWPKDKVSLSRMIGAYCALAERKGKVMGYIIAFLSRESIYLWDMTANKFGEALLNTLMAQHSPKQVTIANLHDKTLLSILQKRGYVITHTLEVMRLKLKPGFW